MVNHHSTSINAIIHWLATRVSQARPTKPKNFVGRAGIG